MSKLAYTGAEWLVQGHTASKSPQGKLHPVMPLLRKRRGIGVGVGGAWVDFSSATQKSGR